VKQGWTAVVPLTTLARVGQAVQPLWAAECKWWQNEYLNLSVQFAALKEI